MKRWNAKLNGHIHFYKIDIFSSIIFVYQFGNQEQKKTEHGNRIDFFLSIYTIQLYRNTHRHTSTLIFAMKTRNF